MNVKMPSQNATTRMTTADVVMSEPAFGLPRLLMTLDRNVENKGVRAPARTEKTMPLRNRSLFGIVGQYRLHSAPRPIMGLSASGSAPTSTTTVAAPSPPPDWPAHRCSSTSVRVRCLMRAVPCVRPDRRLCIVAAPTVSSAWSDISELVRLSVLNERDVDEAESPPGALGSNAGRSSVAPRRDDGRDAGDGDGERERRPPPSLPPERLNAAETRRASRSSRLARTAPSVATPPKKKPAAPPGDEKRFELSRTSSSSALLIWMRGVDMGDGWAERCGGVRGVPWAE